MANVITPSWLLLTGIAPEVTWNTPVAATDFLPIAKPKWETKYEEILDDGFRSNASLIQAAYQGIGHSEVDQPDMLFYPNASGHYLMGMLGADAVTGVNPYTHTLTLLNSALPRSYTFQKYSGLLATADQVAGAYLESVQLKFVNPGRLTVASKAQGLIQTQATKPTAAYDANAIVLPWQAAVTLAGGATLKLIDADITLKRTLEGVAGFSGTQNWTGINLGPLAVDGKLIFTPTDHTELNYYLNNTQPALSIVFTSGTNSLTLQMSKTFWTNPTLIDHGSPYAKTSATFKAVANSTDAGTGNAPFKAVLVNSRATTY